MSPQPPLGGVKGPKNLAGEVWWVDTPNGPYETPKCVNSLSMFVRLLERLHVKRTDILEHVMKIQIS